MRKITLLIVSLLTVAIANAQALHTIDFEPAGTGADWTWTMDQNSDNPALEFVANPSAVTNTSATVAKFTARQAGNPWALIFTDDDGEFTFDGSNSTVKIMVYKPTTSDVAIKFEGGPDGAIELKMANTVTNAWEELTFDFSGQIGNTYARMVIIPDFVARTQDNVLYLDNIVVPNGVVVPPASDPANPPAAPTNEEEDVISVYSDAFTTNIATNLNPSWGQSTTTTEVDYSGNKILKYDNLNYQGLEYTNTNITSMEYIHLDYYTDDATNLDFYLIAGGENAYDIDAELGITTGAWVSVDIEIATAYPARDLANAFQFKTVGNGTVYLDNIYFWREPIVAGTDATLSDLKVDGVTVDGFSSGQENYLVDLVEGTVAVPQITAVTTTDGSATPVITQAPSIPGNATVVVTAADGTTTKTYTVTMMHTIPGSAPSASIVSSSNVLSIFSDESGFGNLPATWNPAWGQTTQLTDVVIAANNVKRYSNFNFSGIEPTGGTLDLTSPLAITHVNFDYWASDATELALGLVDYRGDGAWGGDNIQVNVSRTLTNNSWNTISIPLTEYTALNASFALDDIGQLILVATGASNAVYIDNLYFSVGSALSVDEVNLVDASIYPNPTSNVWNVRTTNEGIEDITIFNVFGKELMRINSENDREAQINAENFKSGIYIANIRTASGVKTLKLIKK